MCGDYLSVALNQFLRAPSIFPEPELLVGLVEDKTKSNHQFAMTTALSLRGASNFDTLQQLLIDVKRSALLNFKTIQKYKLLDEDETESLDQQEADYFEKKLKKRSSMTVNLEAQPKVADDESHSSSLLMQKFIESRKEYADAGCQTTLTGEDIETQQPYLEMLQ